MTQLYCVLNLVPVAPVAASSTKFSTKFSTCTKFSTTLESTVRVVVLNLVLNLVVSSTVELSKTKLGTLPPLVLGGIIENQNSDFVMT